jgi:hypothetical protein
MPEKDLPNLNDLHEVNRQCTLDVQLYLVAFAQRAAAERGSSSAAAPYNTLQHAAVASWCADVRERVRNACGVFLRVGVGVAALKSCAAVFCVVLFLRWVVIFDHCC